MLQEIQPKKEFKGLIMAPTRELAMQISTEIKKMENTQESKLLQFTEDKEWVSN